MALVTPTEAIRLSGRSKASFYKDVAAGRVSKSLDPSGKTVFDTSELLRVYGSPKYKTSNMTSATEILGQSETEQMRELMREVEHLKSLLNAKDEHIKTLQDTMKLLEYRVSQPVQQPVSQDKPAGLLARLFGR